jgi:hypothetical protein
MTYLIIAIVIIILIGAIASTIRSFYLWLGKVSHDTIARISVDRATTIYDRNQDIIQKFQGEIYGSNQSHYVENKVHDCIGNIAVKEGRSNLVPKSREWLSRWQARPDIPPEYLELKDYLIQLFSEKNELLLSEKRIAEENKENSRQESIANERHKLLERSRDLIDKFLEIAERKVSVFDEYGDENWDALPKEIELCIKKISERESSRNGKQTDIISAFEYRETQNWLRDKLNSLFQEYHKEQTSKEAESHNLNDMSGVEFESWVVKILRDNGFDDVRGTPATGDQGADIITNKDGKKIIIQAKRYKGVVGNKAVQQIISAIQYYGGDEGWVITNSRFTSSARSLAQKANIKLIDGKALSNIKEFLD